MPPVDTIESECTRMPAEWAPHEATWLSWPHNAETWPGLLLAEAQAAMTEVVRVLAPHERVHINVLDNDHRAHVQKLLAAHTPAEQITFHEIATDDAWIRDHGAIFVFAETGSRLALDFDFNAWGGKYPPWDRDQKVAGRMAQALGVPSSRPDMVLEGGSIEVNGSGCLLTTEQCLLNRNRNPSLSRRQIEARLAEHFGVDQIVWLGNGISGDDTDGHIDDITRFVDETTIVTVVERDHTDINYEMLEENRLRLRSLKIAGQPISLTELPMPDPLFAGNQRLPASYANFYIANDVVILPVFADPADAVAVDALRACFPARTVVPVDARALVHGLGGIHCLTQQVPANTQ
jgi:agmatine deiminase